MVLLYVTADFMEQLLYDRLRKCLSHYTMNSRLTPPYKGSFLVLRHCWVAFRTMGAMVVVLGSSWLKVKPGNEGFTSFRMSLIHIKSGVIDDNCITTT
jgi:hypothetical protein